jgi:GAF domain-containing protein
MATTTKKGAQRSKSKPRSSTAKKSRPKQAQTVQELRRALTEASEQQAATSEILRVIASSPTNLQPVLDAIAENAVRVCAAEDALIWRVDDNSLRLVSKYGSLPARDIGYERPLGRGAVVGRAVVDRQTVHVHDLTAVEDDFPDVRARLLIGVRTVLATPLLCEGVPIGAIHIRRTEVRPFSDKQIKLLETFADQAVIAIENARLFQELQARNRDLTEALEQQTATSEILGVIASSPTEIQPVLDVVAENAARLCDSHDAQIYRVEGDRVRKVASYGIVSPVLAIGETRPLSRGLIASRAILDRQLIHIHDMLAEHQEDWDLWHADKQQGIRTMLGVPLLREGVAVGAIMIRRTEVRPFTEKQIALLKTFADQAVIAIENVRLFQELEDRNRQLTEALEQQTSTSEVLKVISRSTFDLQPVLETLVENATRLCGADTGFIFRPDGELLRIAVAWGASPEVRAFYERNPARVDRGTLVGRTILERRTVHVEDVLADPEYQWTESQSLEKYRTMLGVPLLREGVPLGIIGMWREEVRPFTDKQIDLVTTFADQAVIAIENVRLFQELQAKNHDLTQALEQQTATSEVLRVIASSPTELQPVLDTVIANAVRLVGATQGHIRQYDGEILRPVAHYGERPEQIASLQANTSRPILK